jgi:plastocyanin
VLVHESYAQTGRVDVAIRDGGFHPDVVEIAPGASVRWTNQDSMNHTVHEDGDSPGPALPPVSPTPPGAGGGDAPGPGTAVAAAAGLAAAYAVRRRGCRG